MKALAIISTLLLAGCIGDRIAQCNESCNRMVQSCFGSDCKSLLDTCYTQCTRVWLNDQQTMKLQAEQDCSGVKR